MPEVVITESDHGRDLDVAENTTLVVRLSESPTTGYRWALHTDNDSVITLRDSKIELPDALIVGGGGERVFTLVAMSPGVASVFLKHWQEWEGEDSVTKRLEFRVAVK